MSYTIRQVATQFHMQPSTPVKTGRIGASAKTAPIPLNAEAIECRAGCRLGTKTDVRRSWARLSE